jgi:peroxiredoxin|uniref:TlpA family protein disulfide reductase n=1 Tax=Fulvivirga sp. TaxID=1931237 RepID=UPI00404B795C
MTKAMKKEIRFWVIITTIFLSLYLSGLHTEVAGFAQRIILSTGLIAPEAEANYIDNNEDDYDFKLKNIDGTFISFNDLKGKVVFMNIWATWCAPCIAEMPNIQKLYEKMDSSKVAFVMLSTDQSEEKVTKFIDRKGFTFPVYLAASNVPSEFRVPSIPTTFVFSKEGKIVSKNVGMANYDKKSFIKFLNELIEEDTTEASDK